MTLRQACQRSPVGAICVQRFDDSLNSAIHITYRSLLRSSSMHEPRDPSLKVVSQVSFWFGLNWFEEGGVKKKEVALFFVCARPGREAKSAHQRKRNGAHGGWKVLDVVMILPQVHLRKPCYDFYFL